MRETNVETINGARLTAQGEPLLNVQVPQITEDLLVAGEGFEPSTSGL